MDCRRIIQPRIIIVTLAVMLACLTGCAKTQDPVNVTLEILDAEGVSTEFSLNTAKTTLGDALLEAGYVSAKEHTDGLYTTVCGFEANWDEDGAWWQFSKDGEVLSIGMNDAKLSEGDHYELTYIVGFGD